MSKDETDDFDCPVCLDGTVVCDTCDACGERHCARCEHCRPPEEA